MASTSTGPEVAGAAEPRSERLLPWALVGLGGVLTMVAYRGLLTFRPRTGRMLDAESFFFEPSDTSPPIVLILVLWLAMRRSKRFARLAALEGARWLTAGLVALSGAILAWAVHVGAPDLQAVALFFNLLAIANLLGGAAAVRIAVVPACVLGFALPMPGPLLNAVVWKAQIWTANYSGFLLELLDMPALVSGDQILRSNAVFAIIETCSGLRGIETLTLLAFLMADLFGRRGWHAVALVLVAPPIAFAINGFRALGLILNPHSEIDVVHNAQGIAMLLIGVLVLYGVDGLLGRRLKRPPLVVQDAPPGTRRARLIPRLAIACGVLAMMVGVTLTVPSADLPPLRVPDAGTIVPEELGGWSSTQADTDWLFLGKVGMRQVVHRSYAKRGRSVSLFVGLGASELRFQSVLSPKTGVPGSGWTVEDEGELDVDGRTVTYRVVRKGTRRLLLHHWYEGMGGILSESLRVISGIEGSKFRRNRNTLVVRLATPIGRRQASRHEGEIRLREFSSLMTQPLQQLAVPAGS